MVTMGWWNLLVLMTETMARSPVVNGHNCIDRINAHDFDEQ